MSAQVSSSHSFPFTCRILNPSTRFYLQRRTWRGKKQEPMTIGREIESKVALPLLWESWDSSCFLTDSCGVDGGQMRMWGGRQGGKRCLQALAQHPGEQSSLQSFHFDEGKERWDWLATGCFSIRYMDGGLYSEDSFWLNVTGSFNHISLESSSCYPKWGHAILQ